MQKRNSLIIAAFAITAVSTSLFSTAKAEENNCDFTNGLKQLSQAQEMPDWTGGTEKIKSELSARKSLLEQTIDCSINETLKRQSSVKLADVSDYADLPGIKNRIVSKFDEIISYYKMQKDAVNDLGVEGSKIFSANLKSWRDSNFVPADDLGKNFIIFVKNQNILQTTENRFYQISITLKALGLSDSQKIGDILNQARKNIKLAEDDNDSAKDIFSKMVWPNNTSDLMTSSLQHLKDAYQNFFDVGKEAQEEISSSK